MANDPASPLLGTDDRHDVPETAAQNGQEQSKTQDMRKSKKSRYTDESTPLLARDPDREDDENTLDEEGPATDFLSVRSAHGDGQKPRTSRWRWPTIVSICSLTILLLAILAFGFALPTVVQEYAEQAAVFEPTNLSIASITSSGVKARIQGDFVLDASRVKRKSVQDLGRFGTWIAAAVQATPSDVEVRLPERDNVLLGTAQIPSITVSIRNGEINHLDFVADIQPGKFGDLGQVAKDWVDGRLTELRVKGTADVALKSGMFYLGTQTVSREILFKGSDVPKMPQYDISKFNIHEVRFPDGENGIAVDAVATVANDYPLTFAVPPMAFEILVPGCMQQPSILVANATTEELLVTAKQDFTVNAQGLIRDVPDNLVAICPDSLKSPLDNLLNQYMSGDKTTFYVRGAALPVMNTPDWIAELAREVTVPLSVTGHSFRNLIRNFTMSDVHFGLPNPIADPDSPEARPKISAAIQVTANLPKEMNFPIKVPHVRAFADVLYKEKKLGELDLHEWQKSSSQQIEAHGDSPPGIIIRTNVKDAPLNITDSDVFQEVVSAMLFGKEKVQLEIKAKVDIETSSALGKLIVRDIPARGDVPIQPLSEHGFKRFAPKIGSLKLLDTTSSSIHLSLLVNITNPTNYSATVPFVDVQILVNNTLVGHASTEAVHVSPGHNENLPIRSEWNPSGLSGQDGAIVGKELISQYISGYNTTLTLRTHNGTIPALPMLGHALSNFSVDIPTPKLKTPSNPNRPVDDPDNDRPRFIDDATMHLISSTATFTLLSPLQHETLYITSIDATAFYNHTDPVGQIVYDLPFAVHPGATTTPRLPVDWSLDSVGYDAIKQALGGTLKLDARATVGVKVGQWVQEVWFVGHGIGAHVRI